MKKKLNVVIDLETLSMQPDAAILSVAAVPFNIEAEVTDSDSPHPNAGLPSYHEVVNVASCALSGMHFDMDTVQWWSRQSDEAKASILERKPLINISNAISGLHQFLCSLAEEHNAELVIWCQGTDFDIPKLKYAFDKFLADEPKPWKYYNQRDARTFLLTNLTWFYGEQENLYDMIPTMPDDVPYAKHSAWCDAMFTAWAVTYVYGLCRSTFAATTSSTTPK